jgi:hypothetical protein
MRAIVAPETVALRNFGLKPPRTSKKQGSQSTYNASLHRVEYLTIPDFA